MRVSPDSRLRLARLLVALSLPIVSGGFAAAAERISRADGVGAGQRLAQQGPVRLMPRRGLLESVAEPEKSPPSKEETPPDIQVEDLGEIDPDAVGVLGTAVGGYGPAMWLGTPRSVIERLLGALSNQMTSPILRSLARRLLLTAAAPPPPEDAGAKGRAPGIVAIRVERLLAMGLVEDAKKLIGVSPLRRRDPALLRFNAETMLLGNDIGGACAEAKRDPERLLALYWQRLSVFCQAISGNAEGARFGATVLAENPEFDDNAFLALIDRLTGGDAARIESLPAPTPLHLAMLRSANTAAPEDALRNAPPPVLRAIGASPHTELDIRLDAAERAAKVGAITPDRLGEIYMSVAFDNEELTNALTVADEKRTPYGRALLYRAARTQTVPTAKAAVIQKAFELAWAERQIPVVVRLYRKILLDLPVSAELAWFAGDAARGLLALGETGAARPWLTLLQVRQHRDPDARAARDGMWALGIIAGVDGYRVEDRNAMTAWLNVQRSNDSEAAERNLGLALSLLRALGVESPERYWQDLLEPPRRIAVSMPQALYPQALRNAARGGRLGEAVLLILLALRPEAPAASDALLLAEAVAALRAVGLERDARALALEAALAEGI